MCFQMMSFEHVNLIWTQISVVAVQLLYLTDRKRTRWKSHQGNCFKDFTRSLHESTLVYKTAVSSMNDVSKLIIHVDLRSWRRLRLPAVARKRYEFNVIGISRLWTLKEQNNKKRDNQSLASLSCFTSIFFSLLLSHELMKWSDEENIIFEWFRSRFHPAFCDGECEWETQPQIRIKSFYFSFLLRPIRTQNFIVCILIFFNTRNRTVIFTPKFFFYFRCRSLPPFPQLAQYYDSKHYEIRMEIHLLCCSIKPQSNFQPRQCLIRYESTIHRIISLRVGSEIMAN